MFFGLIVDILKIMEEIIFEADQENLPERLFRNKKPKGLVGLVMKLSGGFVQSETMANGLLFILALFFFFLSFFILLNTFN